MYRVNAVGKDGRAIVLATADTATHALMIVRDAYAEYPRAWVTDETDMDVSMADLIERAEEESLTPRA